MDAFFESLKDVAVLLLPTLGALSLIFLLVLFKGIFDVLKKVQHSLDHLEKTLGIVDETLAEVQVPVRTVANVARGIDTVTSVAQHSVLSMSKLVIENFDLIQEWFKSLFKPKHASESVSEPSEGDSI